MSTAIAAMDRAFDALGLAHDELHAAASEAGVAPALRNDLRIVAGAIRGEAEVVNELVRRVYLADD